MGFKDLKLVMKRSEEKSFIHIIYYPANWMLETLT